VNPGLHVVFFNHVKILLDQDQQLSEDEGLPLGVEASINEDVFDLEDLEEDEELNADRVVSQASLASSTFVSAIHDVRKKMLCQGFLWLGNNFCFSSWFYLFYIG
jgi:hypothetical protein